MPKVTGNAQLLLGYVSGLLIKDGQSGTPEPLYRVIEVDAAAGAVSIAALSGNTYRLTIVQTGGEE